MLKSSFRHIGRLFQYIYGFSFLELAYKMLINKINLEVSTKMTSLKLTGVKKRKVLNHVTMELMIFKSPTIYLKLY